MSNTSRKNKIILVLLLSVILIILFFVGGFFIYKNNNTALTETQEIEANCIKNYSQKTFVKSVLRDIEFYNHGKMEKHINRNFDNFLKDESNVSSSILNYANLYKNSFYVLNELRNTKTIKYKDYTKLKEDLNKLNFNKIQERLRYITLKTTSSDRVARKKFFEGMIAELNFNNLSAETFYKEANSLNLFEAKYYINLGSIYHRKYKFNDALSTFSNGLNILNSSNKKNKEIELLLILNLAETNRVLNNVNDAIKFYNNLSITSKNYNNLNYEWVAVYNLGNIEASLGNYLLAENYIKYALKLANKNRNNNQIANSLNVLSKIDYNYGSYEDGKKNALKTIKIAKRMKNLPILAGASFNACLNYEYLGRTDLALNYCKRAIKINKTLGYVTKRPEMYLQNGYIYSFVGSLRDYNLSLDNYKKAYSISNQFNLKILSASALSGISNAESMLGQKAQAVIDLEKSIKIRRNLGMREQSCDSCNLGFISWGKKDYNGALANYKNAIIFASETMNNSIIFTATSHISSIYLELKDYDKALRYSKVALDAAKSMYRFDHHYIKYQKNIQDDIEKLLTKRK